MRGWPIRPDFGRVGLLTFTANRKLIPFLSPAAVSSPTTRPPSPKPSSWPPQTADYQSSRNELRKFGQPPTFPLTLQYPRPTLNPVGRGIRVGASRPTPPRPLRALARRSQARSLTTRRWYPPQPLASCETIPRSQAKFAGISPYSAIFCL